MNTFLETYNNWGLRACFEEALTISECLSVTQMAIDSDSPPPLLLDAIMECAHPLAVMSQLSELLGNRTQNMDPYMQALRSVDPDDWGGNAQQFVDSYWGIAVLEKVKKRHYRSAYRSLRHAAFGYGAVEAALQDHVRVSRGESYQEQLILSASRDLVRKLTHALYRAMRNDVNCSLPGDHSPAVPNKLAHPRAKAGGALVYHLGLFRPGSFLTDQFGSEMLAIAAHVRKPRN